MDDRRQVEGYRRASALGHCLGSFPVLELLRHAPGRARLVALRSDLAAERRRPIERLCGEQDVEVRSDDGLLRRVAHRKDVDAFALFEKYRAPLDREADHVVLVEPGNPGNLGTIMRTMVAFGVRDLALVGTAADHWSPHVVRASIGARFQLRVEEFGALAEYAHWRDRPLHLFSGEAQASLEEEPLPSPFTLVFGPEWPGLPAEALELGRTVSIPQSDAVESLNVAVAAGIALFWARVGAEHRGAQEPQPVPKAGAARRSR